MSHAHSVSEAVADPLSAPARAEMAALAVHARHLLLSASAFGHQGASAEAAEAWSIVHHLLFSDEISGRADALAESLHLKLDFLRPNLSAEEDATAYVNALTALSARLTPFPA